MEHENRFQDSASKLDQDNQISNVIFAESRFSQNDSGEGSASMDDKDVRHLESQIAASEERAQLRLENALTRIESQIERIIEQTAAMRHEMTEQRVDARALRSELHDEIASSIAVTRSWGTWIIGTILVVIVLAVSVDIGLRQVWAGGIQVGQAMHSANPPHP